MSIPDQPFADETPQAVSDTPPLFGATAPTWQDHDGLLRDMWLQNQTPQAIASTLGRSVPAIMTRAARLGLPRRSAPGRKPGRRPQDGTARPAMTSPRAPTASAVGQSFTQTAPQTSLRVCLMCLNKFESLGRHNRICARCRGSSEYESAAALPELNIPV